MSKFTIYNLPLFVYIHCIWTAHALIYEAVLKVHPFNNGVKFCSGLAHCDLHGL